MEKQNTSIIQKLGISYECALAIGNSLDLEEMFHEFIHTIVHKTNAHRGIIWFRNKKEKDFKPIASAGIRIKDILAKKRINSLQKAFRQISKKQQFVLKNKDDKDFLQYCSIITGKEESILIIPVNNVVMIHLIYARRDIVDKSLANLLISLTHKLSVAIDACIAHDNIIKEIRIREKAEEQLISSEEQYRTLIDNIQDGVFIIQDNEMKFVNEAFARIVGYTIEEVVGMDFRQLIAPEDNRMVTDRYRRRQAGEDVPREYEFRMLHKDGITRVIVNMNIGLITYRGRIASMGTVKDITGKKKAEEELKKRTEQLIFSQKELEKLYAESEESRKSLLSILEDVTETEKALRASEGRFQDIAINTGDWIWETDQKGCYTYCSPVVKQV
ncbi:PAS domain S-box protein, partial [candidate division WOR-3 bacterium]|nr:PAS domain S-box protein [candidate division WOR-3 bacterium]